MMYVVQNKNIEAHKMNYNEIDSGNDTPPRPSPITSFIESNDPKIIEKKCEISAIRDIVNIGLGLEKGEKPAIVGLLNKLQSSAHNNKNFGLLLVYIFDEDIGGLAETSDAISK